MDYEKLSGNKVSESSESIRAKVQAARNIHQARFTNPDSLISNKSSSTEIICNADMRIGEIFQFCHLQAEGQSLMREAASCCAHGAVRESIAVIPTCLSLPHEIDEYLCRFSSKRIYTIRAPGRGVLYLRPPEDHDVMNTLFEHDIRFINKQTLNQFYYLLT